MEPFRTPPNTEPSTSLPSPSSSTREIRLRKTNTTPQSSSNNTSSIWKSEKTQQLFSSKLLSALRQVHVTPRSPSTPRRSRAIKEAADTALAVAAKGRTRWSQAILTNKIKVKYLNKKHKRQKVSITGPSRLPSVSTRILSLKGKGKGKELPGVERKVKTLGRLVPGCRKETLPVILEEATDYIPALEMQIRAMRDLLSRLSAVSSSVGNGDGGVGVGVSGGSSPPPPNNETVL